MLISGFWNFPSWVIEISILIDQKSTKAGGTAGPPNTATTRQAHRHLVPFLQLQDCRVSSIIEAWSTCLIVKCLDNDLVVLHQLQPCFMLVVSMVGEGEEVKTRKRSLEDTCEQKTIYQIKRFLALNKIWFNLTVWSLGQKNHWFAMTGFQNTWIKMKVLKWKDFVCNWTKYIFVICNTALHMKKHYHVRFKLF